MQDLSDFTDGLSRQLHLFSVVLRELEMQNRDRSSMPAASALLNWCRNLTEAWSPAADPSTANQLWHIIDQCRR